MSAGTANRAFVLLVFVQVGLGVDDVLELVGIDFNPAEIGIEKIILREDGFFRRQLHHVYRPGRRGREASGISRRKHVATRLFWYCDQGDRLARLVYPFFLSVV